jgi:precorrin-6Y C5,15-methyltransferase (decarboxylating)
VIANGRDIRAVALAALGPVTGHLLWDIGAGSGAVAIEWMRAAPGARAIAIERDGARAQAIARGALAVGVPDLRVIEAEAPAALDELGEPPDAIYVGGGLTTYGLLTRCCKALAPGGRLVAQVTTVEGETFLSRAQAERGGRLKRVTITHAEPVGDFTGWRPEAPVTQWELRVP